jgi:hypothetical protein
MAETLASLAASLGRAAALITPVATQIVHENAQGVREKWLSVFPWSGSAHLKHLPASVTVDPPGLEVEIGPVKGDQGSLGHIIEFGSVNSGAHPGGGPAAMAQAPIFAAELAIAAEALLAGSGRTSVATSDPSRYNAPIGPRR